MNQEGDINEKQQAPATGGRSTLNKIVRGVLFFAGSAVFGGLAVSLWERKTLTALRRREGEQAAPAQPEETD